MFRQSFSIALPPRRHCASTQHRWPPVWFDRRLYSDSDVERLDAAALEELLTQAAVMLSQPILIEQVIVPLMYRIGDRWHEGTLRAAHEHLASAVIRTA